MHKRWTGMLLSVIGQMLCLVVNTQLSAAAPLSLRAAIHVHSTASTGSMSLESLARRAEEQRLDVLILSENFTLRYDYGLQPFEGFLKYHTSFPSIMEYGVQRFLDEVQQVQRRHPNLVLIPGIEVAPYYYWTGSLLSGDLTMHDAQRNLLIIGLQNAEDYAGLPARGNAGSFVWDSRSLINGFPLLLIMAAGWLWMARIRETRRSIRRSLAAMVLIVSMGLMLQAWPVKSPIFSSYDAQVGYQPYQALIDHAIRQGALVFWSMPESRDFSQHSFGPLGTVTIQTEPHPEALILTHGYTGFGGLYQDTRHMIAPGGLWDQLLSTRATDDRGPGFTVIGEVAFHGTSDAGKDLDRVYTMIQSSDRTAVSILSALRAGRVYAVSRADRNILLRLDEFSVSQGGESVGMGDTIKNNQDHDMIVHIGVSTVDEQPHSATVRLIRSGRIIKQLEGLTPLRMEVVDREAPLGEQVVYRVDVIGNSGELLTNPIYVRPKESRI